MNSMSSPVAPQPAVIEAFWELLMACDNQELITPFGGLLKRRMAEAREAIRQFAVTQAAPVSPRQIDEIAEFESWARTVVMDGKFNLTRCQNESCKDQFHHYASTYTNAALSAWQARAKLDSVTLTPSSKEK